MSCRPLHIATGLLAISILATLPLDARAANLVTNGGFEQVVVPNGINAIVPTGSGLLVGWTVGPTSGIDLARTLWQPSEGLQSISLNWVSPTTISQVISDAPGTSYTLSFDLAGEPDGPINNRTLNVLWNGSTIASPSFAYTGQPAAAMGWVPLSFTVTGTGSDTLAFASTTTFNYGPTLDNVALNIAPEPTSLSLLVLGSFALLRRRMR